MTLDSKILVTGHRGLVGSAVVRALKQVGFRNLITWDRTEVDLCQPIQVRWAFSSYLPEYVFHCAARVGGIVANRDNPVDFLLDNLKMEINVLENAHAYSKKLIFLGSACAYPKFASNPIKESALLTGEMEPTNLNYALAKIVGIRLCQSYFQRSPCQFVSVMPTNLYGVNDNYHATDSHVIPGMIRRIHEAKESGADAVTLWGSGTPTRDFLFSDDLAKALLLLMVDYTSPELINVGTGRAVSLHSLAHLITKVVEFDGEIRWDRSKPDGTPERYLDIFAITKLRWEPTTPLVDGLRVVYEDFKLCKRR